MFFGAEMLGQVNRIPEDARAQLIEIREQFFKT
jgi:hypothetical protein